MVDTKDIWIKYGYDLSQKDILERVLDLLAFDWNNEGLKILREELTTKIKGDKI